MAIHFSILAWRAPGTEEPGGPQSLGSCVGHELKQRGTLVRDRLERSGMGTQSGKATWLVAHQRMFALRPLYT